MKAKKNKIFNVCLLTALSVMLYSTPVLADELYYEDFNSLGGSFTCSDSECEWISDNINIIGISNMIVSADAQSYELGEFESADYLRMFYSIDDGAWTNFFDHTDDLPAQTIKRVISASGSVMRLKIEAKTSAGNETYEVDNLTVTDAGSSSIICPDGQDCYLITDVYGGQWQDVEKDPNTSHDNLWCWVAGPTNILAWSGWGKVDGMQTTDDLFAYCMDYWPPADMGEDAYDVLEWFFVGDQPDEDFPAGGGFYPEIDFPGYCNSDQSDPYVGVCPGDFLDNPKILQELLDAGFAFALQLKEDEGGSSGSHVITMWGYSVDENDPDGLMTGVFLTDSDDDKSSTNPPDVLYYREVYYDGVWHILREDGSPYKYIKYAYGLKQKYNNPTSLSEINITKPDGFILKQNYPNPFNPSTTIEYSIPVNKKSPPGRGFRGGLMNVRLNIYDILGNVIAVVVDREQPPGNYQVNFDASHLPSGVYLMQMNAGNFSALRKMILMK